MDAFPPLFCSHTWYVYFYRFMLYSHVSDIIICRLSPPWWSRHHWGWLCELFFVWGQDLYLDRPHRVSLMQAGLKSIGLSYIYGFRPFLRVSVKYFTIYSHFSLNLYPPFLHPVFSFRTRSDLFLGGIYVCCISPASLEMEINDRYVISLFVFHPYPQSTL